ncbi:cyclin-like protein [Crassisporium funariophilum]|nr:cyclin-like protein [Crassisporium funariophilum]
MRSPNNYHQVDSQSSRAQTPSQLPTSSTNYYHPYFSPAEIDYLSEKQRGKRSVTQEEKDRQSACTFLEIIGARVGFPRRTISTSQILYHRFRLFFSGKDFKYHEVALGALYVSTKMHDTLKKPRELLAVSYAIIPPDPPVNVKSKHPGGEIDLDTVHPDVVEKDRQRLLAVERLILETICFNFTARTPFPYVIKLGKEFRASKKLIKLAWRISIDSNRTLLPLIYPPHSIALGSLYVAGLLLSFEQPPSPRRNGEQSSDDIAKKLNTHLSWEEHYHTKTEDLEDFAHTILDLLIQYTQNPSANTSPNTPSSPSPPLSTRDRHAASQSHQYQYPYNPDQLIRLKIAMRATEHTPRRRKALDGSDPSALYNADSIGQSEGTVRFLFFPPGFEGDVPVL